MTTHQQIKHYIKTGEVKRTNDHYNTDPNASPHDRPWYQGPDAPRLLQTKSANDWLKDAGKLPVAQTLFGSFWFENELCIMFADTNLGKSVLAVQIGDCLSRGQSLQPFHNAQKAPSRVLYIDFELSAKQFEARYTSNTDGTYAFSNEFFRAEFNPAAYVHYLHGDYEKFLDEAFNRAILDLGPDVLIIDNITYLSKGTERTGAALALMQSLKALKQKRKLSILVLAHTPKRNAQKPLTVNDLQGSKMLINFADSAFAIGQSYSQPGLRYLKQIKQRNQGQEYGEDNVCLVSQQKEANFLKFKFEGQAHERDHLPRRVNLDKETIHRQAINLHQQGRSLRQIADQLGIHFSTAGRIIQVAREAGEMEVVAL
jgi:hypothetical protein